MKKIKNRYVAALAIAAVGASLCAGAMLNVNASAETELKTVDQVSFEMLEGASVRLGALHDSADTTNGLRFMAKLSQADYEGLKANVGEGKAYSDISYGVIIIPADYVTTGYEFTEENVFGTAEKTPVYAEEPTGTQKKMLNVESRFNQRETTVEETTTIHYEVWGSITELEDYNLTREFVGRAYIAYTVGSGDEATTAYKFADYYEDAQANNTRSAVYVAQRAAEDTAYASKTYQNTEKTNGDVIEETYMIDSVTSQTTKYTVEQYTLTEAGEETKISSSSDNSANIGASLSVAEIANDLGEVDGYVLKNGAETATAYANNKQTVKLYYRAEKVVKDGSEMVWALQTAGTYSEVTEGDLAGAYYYKPSANWNDKLEVKETSVVTTAQNSAGTNETSYAARVNMTNKGFTTVSLDLYLGSGANVGVYAPNGADHNGAYLDEGAALENANAGISVYRDGMLVPTGTVIDAETWYTVVVEYDFTATGLASVQICRNWPDIYVDNVCYYRNDSWKDTLKNGLEVSVSGTVIEDVATTLSKTLYIDGVEAECGDITLKDDANGAATLNASGELVFSTAGEHTVTLTTSYGGAAYDKTITVNVIASYDEFDGADALVLKSGATATMTVETTDPTASGRTNVTKYNTGASGWWANRLLLLNLTEENPAYEGNKTLVANALRAENYQYVAIDFYLSSGSNTCALYYPDGTSAGASFNLATNGTAANAVPESEVIKFYKDGVLLTTSDTIAKGAWYTVVIDLSGALNASNPNVSFNGTANNTWYFDNIRYYRNDTWKTDYVNA